MQKNHYIYLLVIALLFPLILPAQIVELNVGDNFQNIVNANPAGTTYLVKTGVHRLQSVRPKDNDKFIGEERAVLNGSRILDNWQSLGNNLWVHYGQNQQGAQYQSGWCLPGFPRCHFPEDLFVNNEPLVHKDSNSGLGNNEWFFDQPNDAVYIAFDPTGLSIEIGVKSWAFMSETATGVLIENLIIEKYASTTQRGAIGRFGEAISWTVRNCELRLNHGAGLSFSGRSFIQNNYIHDNGQIGIRGTRNNNGVIPIGCIVEDNEISYNLYANYNWKNEGGGTKFSYTDSLVLRNNYVHHNGGPGLWTDIKNDSSNISGNWVEYNDGPGIFHEISYAADIYCNTVRYNNQNYTGLGNAYGSNIFISNSSNVKVYNNVCVSNAAVADNGIIVLCDGRQDNSVSPPVPYYSNDNQVYENDITYENVSGISGLYRPSDCSGEMNNVFQNNTYHSNDTAFNHFIWGEYSTRGPLQFMLTNMPNEGIIDNIIKSNNVITACSPTGIVNQVIIRAKGDAGQELMKLKINEQYVFDWIVTKDWHDYPFNYFGNIDELRVYLSNHYYEAGVVDYNLNIDYVIVNSDTLNTNSPTTYGESVRIDPDFCASGYNFTVEKIFCPGFIEYIRPPAPECVLDVQVFLEGAYANGELTTQLNNAGLLPENQPYQIAPWNHSGTESISPLPQNAVDWVLISLRTGTDAATEVHQEAALLLNDGTILLPDNCLAPADLSANAYYIVIEHRNQMGVMTPNPVSLNNGLLTYDFRSQDSYKSLSSTGQTEAESGVWAMAAGDMDQSDMVSYDINGSDKAIWQIANGLFADYFQADLNFDGEVNGADKAIWNSNSGRFSAVPK